MSKLLQRLQDPKRSGVYRVRRVDEVLEATKGSSLDVARIVISDKASIIRSIATALAFPDWFGNNWDALEDCLGDLSWRKGEGHVLLLEAAPAGDERGILLDVLAASAEFWKARGKSFFAVFVDPAGTAALPELFRGAMSFKLPVSVLVVVHTAALDILLLERARRPGFWQSVTGSLDRPDEPFAAAAAREVREETGIDAARGRLEDCNVVNAFEIFTQWRHRYGPGVTHNTEHVFGLELPAPLPVTLSDAEHTAWRWLPWREAAALCFSWTNREAIERLARRAGAA